MKELDLLLENFWIIKETDKELYYKIKDAIPKFKQFIEEKLGYKLIVNPYLLKLEKLPGKSEVWMGIQDFEDKLEYAILCTILIFLEDKGAGDQFVLSELTDFISANFPQTEKLDWTIFRHRKHLVKVLRFSAEVGFIKVDDGDEKDFMEAVETEVLYESTGLSRYFMRNFTGNITEYTCREDFENSEWLNTAQDRGIVRRNRVYRRLVMSPALYSSGEDDSDFAYIRNFRAVIQNDLEDLLGAKLHIHKSSAYLFIESTKSAYRDVFPNTKNISDLVLILNRLIIEKLENSEIKRKDDDSITVSKIWFAKLVKELRDECLHNCSKEFREMTEEKLNSEIIIFMKSFSMIEVDELDKEIKILPAVGKLTGKYKDALEKYKDKE